MAVAQYLCGKTRYKGKGNQQTCHQHIADGKAHICEYLACKALCKYDRQEHAYSCQCTCSNSAANLFCAYYGSFYGRVAKAAQTVDIFDNNDTVVNQHTNRKGKA